MAVLKILTQDSFIVETNSGEKMGIIVNYDEGTTENTGIEFFSIDGNLKFSSMQELEDLLGEEFSYKEIEIQENHTNTKAIEEYPVNDTDTVLDVQNDPVLGISTFRKSSRSKKRFYPGWWIVKNESGAYNPRCTISVDIYNERNGTDSLHGPFKTFMEVTYTLKQL